MVRLRLLFGRGEIASPWARDRAIAGVHAAALAHHWIFRDRTLLKRMLPGKVA